MSSNQVEIVDQMQVKVNELCMKMDELEHELTIKSGTVDRKFENMLKNEKLTRSNPSTCL
jgi:hypothetical protein